MTFPSDGSDRRRVAFLAAALIAAALSLTPSVAGAQGQMSEPDQTRTVRVEQGDTLSSLAEQHLGSAARWRIIHRANAGRLESPHRLRPGTSLVIPAPGRRIGVVPDTVPRPRPEASVFSADERVGLGDLRLSSRRPVSRVAPTEFASAPLLLEPGTLGAVPRTARRVGETPRPTNLPISLTQRDRVVLSAGSHDLRPGALLQAIHWGARVEGRGRVALPVAILEVLELRGDSAVARVTRRYGQYRIGDVALPLPDLPDLRGGQFAPVGEGPVARLVGPAMTRPVARLGSILFLDAGADSGIRPGDEFRVPGRSAETLAGDGPTARLRVIRVSRHSSTVRVMKIDVAHLEPGTEARLVRRLVIGEEG